jgi:CRP-like cAMP-binding protein
MALLTSKPRTASVVTLEPTTVGILERKDFEELLMQYPKIGVSLTRILAERVESASTQVGIEYVALSKVQFDSRVLSLLPEQTIMQHKVLPVALPTTASPSPWSTPTT